MVAEVLGTRSTTMEMEDSRRSIQFMFGDRANVWSSKAVTAAAEDARKAAR
jgi:hypothetical protein